MTTNKPIKIEDKKYFKNDKYDLKSFLSDRFKLIEKDVKEHLENLITD